MKTLFPAVSASQNLTTFQQLAKSISTNIYDISASSIPKHYIVKQIRKIVATEEPDFSHTFSLCKSGTSQFFS